MNWPPSSFRMCGLLCLMLGGLFTAGTACGQQSRFHGLVFGDAYWVAASEDQVAEGQNGLWFRRIYLTFDFVLSENWSSRLRAEMASSPGFTAKSKLEPFAKDVYLRWKKGDTRLFIGLSPTPTWSLIEGYWGYRSVEKTMFDLQKMGASRDIGVALQGRLGEGKRIGYHLMLANGNGTSTETNQGKKAMLSVSFTLSENIVVEIYGDADDRPGDTDRFSLQGFLGFRNEKGSAGLQYFLQKRNEAEDPGTTFNGLSVFGALRLSPRVSGYLRFDRMFDLNPAAAEAAYLPFDARAESNFLLAGLDLQPHEQVHFQPNVEVVFFDETGGITPAATVIPRLTFFYTFN